MAQYKKSGIRTFYKITDDETVIKILNMERMSQISVSKNPIIMADANDPYDSKSITQGEFEEQFAIAFDRLTKQTIE